MQRSKHIFLVAAFILLPALSISLKAQQNQPDGQPTSANVVAVAPAPLLTSRLAGITATGEVKQYAPDKLSDIVGDKAEIYREYRVISATSRRYGQAQVDLFQTSNRFASYGLFSYFAESKPDTNAASAIGTASARTPDGLIFHKGNYFVRVNGAASPSAQARIAEAIAQKITTPTEEGPPLLKSINEASDVAQGRGYTPLMQAPRYFLGPQSLGSYVEHAREMFDFFGEAEAVVVEYGSSAPEYKPKVVIVEYHTPQFATDAMAKVNGYLDSLPADERSRFVVKREGNYIIEAVDIESELASELINSVEYPYSVKWLRDPLLLTNDPFRQQKTAEMLLSTFGILGVILGTVFVGGTIFGAVTFIKRRREQRQAFSDAGGMLRLDIDPFEATMLGLPPHRSEE